MNIFNITDDINQAWLKQTSIDIMHGVTTMKEAAEHAQFDSMTGSFEKPISVDTLHKLFVRNGLQTYQRGRIGHALQMSNDAETFIKKNYEELKIGTRKMYELCVDSNISVSRRMIEQYYKSNYPTNSQKKAEEHTAKYECKEVNSVWHGDIHYLDASEDNPTRGYLYALIDDASRYIVGYKFALTKDCNFVASVFQEAIDNAGRPPLIYWSDNGLENLGPEMRTMFQQYDIRHIRTRPRRPKSNGKIERFWQGIKNVVKGKTKWAQIIDAIDTYITYYNNIDHHRGLKKIGKSYPTPKQIFNDPLRQTSDRKHATIIVDGKEKSLSELCKEEEDHVIPSLLSIKNLLN